MSRHRDILSENGVSVSESWTPRGVTRTLEFEGPSRAHGGITEQGDARARFHEPDLATRVGRIPGGIIEDQCRASIRALRQRTRSPRPLRNPILGNSSRKRAKVFAAHPSNPSPSPLGEAERTLSRVFRSLRTSSGRAQRKRAKMIMTGGRMNARLRLGKENLEIDSSGALEAQPVCRSSERKINRALPRSPSLDHRGSSRRTR